jgi:oxygen-independent coproporphyrinogen III oxidase
MRAPALLYTHFPFCPARCSFCRCVNGVPNKVLLNRDLHEAYASALVREVRQRVPNFAERYTPIGMNWGGGTPTALHADLLARVAKAFEPEWPLGDSYFTVEATPDTLTDEALSALAAIGVNRLSIGVESLNDLTLRQMGRRHSAIEVTASIARARAHGFSRISIDLILGYPGESVDDAMRTVREATRLDLSHVVALPYSPAKNTSLLRKIQRKPNLWDPDRYADMVFLAHDELAAAGFRNYEYFHWSRAPHAARFVSLDHYFGHLGDVLGFGAGAHSFVAPHGCLVSLEMPEYLDDPVSRQAGPVDLDFALERAMGCTTGADFDALAQMYGRPAVEVRASPLGRALVGLPGATVTPAGVRIEPHKYLGQYVSGVKARMRALSVSTS